MISYDRGVEIDDTLLHAHLHDYAAVLGDNIGVVIKKQAALFCQDMIRYTAPYAGQVPGGGETTPAKKHGQDSVKSNIMHMFKTLDTAKPSEIAAIGSPEVFKLWIHFLDSGRADPYLSDNRRHVKWSRFEANYKKGLQPIRFIPSGDLLRLNYAHKENRRDGGRGSIMKPSKGIIAVVESPKDLKQFIKEKQANVGFLKSAYYHAAQLIGETKVTFPKWIQHSKAKVNAIALDDSHKPMMPEVTVGNKIGGKLERTERFALKRRGDSMRNAIVRHLSKIKMPLWEAVAHGKITGTLPYFDND